MTDPCSSLTEMIIELKGFQFQSVGEGGGANWQSPPIAQTFVAFYHRNTKIRKLSDKCDVVISLQAAGLDKCSGPGCSNIG